MAAHMYDVVDSPSVENGSLDPLCHMIEQNTTCTGITFIISTAEICNEDEHDSTIALKKIHLIGRPKCNSPKGIQC
jgi:hypothetical protein